MLRKNLVLLSLHFRFLKSEALLNDYRSLAEGTSRSITHLKRVSADLNLTTVTMGSNPLSSIVFGSLIRSYLSEVMEY